MLRRAKDSCQLPRKYYLLKSLQLEFITIRKLFSSQWNKSDLVGYNQAMIDGCSYLFYRGKETGEMSENVSILKCHISYILMLMTTLRTRSDHLHFYKDTEIWVSYKSYLFPQIPLFP